MGKDRSSDEVANDWNKELRWRDRRKKAPSPGSGAILSGLGEAIDLVMVEEQIRHVDREGRLILYESKRR